MSESCANSSITKTKLAPGGQFAFMLNNGLPCALNRSSIRAEYLPVSVQRELTRAKDYGRNINRGSRPLRLTEGLRDGRTGSSAIKRRY